MTQRTLQDRDYQQRAVGDVIAALPRRPLLVAPTGSGKTVMATMLVESHGQRTLWLAHRKELIDQAAAELRELGMPVGVIMAGYAPFPMAKIQVASVATLVNRPLPPADLVVIDEAHHATADTYQRILEGYPDAAVIGLTATPFRLDGRALGDIFGEIVVAAYTEELCDAGYLHAPKVYASKSPDLRGLKVLAGDYQLGALSKRANTPEQNADIVKTWEKRAEGARSVVFAVDVKHSKTIARAFREAGIAAEHLDGTTKREERDAILARLASGETKVVCNCQVLTEGWDLPALECAIVARPTASLNLHLQMIGRIMRSSDDKDGALVLDHAGNHHVHGLVTRRLEYSLDEGSKVGSSEPLGLRRCRECGLFFEVTRFACPECGWHPTEENTPRVALPITGTAELSEFDDESYEYRRTVWNAIEAQREAMDFKPGWSFHRFRERFGSSPVVLAGNLLDTAHATMDEKRAMYQKFYQLALDRGYAGGWAAHRYREAFGVWPRGFVSDVRRDEIRKRYAGATR